MKITSFDSSRYEEMISVLTSVHHHKIKSGADESDVLFYELLENYHRRALQAHNAGKVVVAHTWLIPPEIFFAMDIVPVQLDNAVNTLVTCLKNQEEVFGVAKKFGMASEICSAERARMAMYIEGWFPRPDGVIYSHQVCDSSPKGGEFLCEAYGIPGFYLDTPYGYGAAETEYYAHELGEAISFLERLTGRKMDWERLLETLQYSRQAMTLQKEVYKLRQVIPSPMSSRRGTQSMNIGWLYSGSREAVNYFTVLRDESRARVVKGIAVTPNEEFRLLCLFPPPPIEWKMLDWMEREHGAVIVADPFYSHWGEWKIDPSRLLISLASKCLASPMTRQLHGPASLGALPDALADALSHHAQGAIYWANIGCRHGCALIRSIKDTLMRGAGIPTLVLDSDMLDPTISSDAELKNKLDAFFEMLADRE